MLTVNCPICSAVISGSYTKCQSCGTGLETYVSLFYTPDLLYNEAITLINKKEYYAAADKLAAAHHLRPSDKEIILLMAKCAELSGAPLNAMEKLAILLSDDNSTSVETAEEFERLNGAYEQQQQDIRLEKAVSSLAAERFAELRDIVKKTVQDSIHEMKAEGA